MICINLKDDLNLLNKTCSINGWVYLSTITRYNKKTNIECAIGSDKNNLNFANTPVNIRGGKYFNSIFCLISSNLNKKINLYLRNTSNDGTIIIKGYKLFIEEL